jgi:hypothetical protein
MKILDRSRRNESLADVLPPFSQHPSADAAGKAPSTVKPASPSRFSTTSNPMKPSLRSLLLGLLGLAFTASSATAATTLVSSDFEGSLGAWTISGGATLYTYSTGTNYATTGNGAANLPKSGGTITLTDALLLHTQGYTSITVGFNFTWLNGTTTRFLNVEYAANGTTFVNIGKLTSGNGTTGAYSSITITEGSSVGAGTNINTSSFAYNGAAFADTAKFRFSDVATAGADVRVFVDNIVISGSPTYVVPEPRAALLGGLGLLMLLRRRRS